MADNEFDVHLEGTPEAMADLAKKQKAVRNGAMRGTRDTTLAIRGGAKANLGRAGSPRSRRGILSRGIVDVPPEDRGFFVQGRVGVTAFVPYAAILEFGGWQPGRVIVPVRAKVLRWFTGFRGLAYQAALGAGATVKQATKAATRVRRGSGRGGRRTDVAFARRVHQKGRWQRELPYFRPAIDVERSRIPDTYRRRIREALAGASQGTGEGP